MSLKELGSRAGTSPSAIHRYESGWAGFELRTLDRLAAALGARLTVQLTPAPDATREEPPRSAALIERFRPLFWDVPLEPSHLETYPDWVLRRVLQFGNWDDVHLARRHFGDDAVRRAAGHRSMDDRTQRFWQVVLGPPEEPR
jgi:transcriptional regulator with XRE-family HTH domain